MNCPLCGTKTAVLETDVLDNYTRRRRVCPNCQHRLTTYEVAAKTFHLWKAKAGLLDRIAARKSGEE